MSLDDFDKSIIERYYKIEAFKTKKIYKTKRRIYKVGIYAECSECDAHCDNEEENYMPGEGNSFKIKYGERFYNDKKVKFSYSSDISKRKKYTFGIIINYIYWLKQIIIFKN